MECDVIDRCKVDSSWRSPTAVFVPDNGSPYLADFYGLENFGLDTAFYGARHPSMVSSASFGHENGAWRPSMVSSASFGHENGSTYFIDASTGEIREGVMLAGTRW